MKIQSQRTDGLKHLATLVEKIGVAMLTTIDADGSLRCRPLATVEMDSEPALWFLTSISSPKIGELDESGLVGVSYSDGTDNFVSVSGAAQISRDRAIIARLWTPLAKVWFAAGVNDPDIAALKIQIHRAEYWDRSDNKLQQLYTMAKAMVTGEEVALGENAKLEVGRNA